MALELIEAFSLAGDPAKPNEDAFAHGPVSAVVIDGATNLGDALMPGGNDAAWLARFGARRLIAHASEDKSPRKALRDALADAEKSFKALRRAEPQAMWQLPSASMMFVTQKDEGLEFLSFGDCAALVEQRGEDALVIGATFESRAREAQGARQWAADRNLDPAAGINRPQLLEPLRAGRNRINSGGHWRFSPDAAAAGHAARRLVEAAPGAHVLIASDGFIALASDYGAYDAQGLLDAAIAKGLAALGEETRIIEDNDPLGRQFPRFKKSDDCTALLLTVSR